MAEDRRTAATRGADRREQRGGIDLERARGIGGDVGGGARHPDP